MRTPLTAVLACVLTACAGGSTGSAPAAAPAPAPAATTVIQQAAKVSAPEAPKPALDLSGGYSVSLTYGGMPLAVFLQLVKRTDGTYSGSVSVDQVPQPIPLNLVEADGKKVHATLNTPDGVVVSLDFTVEGDNLTGTYKASNGDGSALSGKKVP